VNTGLGSSLQPHPNDCQAKSFGLLLFELNRNSTSWFSFAWWSTWLFKTYCDLQAIYNYNIYTNHVTKICITQAPGYWRHMLIVWS